MRIIVQPHNPTGKTGTGSPLASVCQRDQTVNGSYGTRSFGDLAGAADHHDGLHAPACSR